MNTEVPTVDELHEEWVKADAKYSGPRGIIQFCLEQLTPLIEMDWERREFEKWFATSGFAFAYKEFALETWKAAREAKP